MSAQITLVLGGIRSGKSAFAEKLTLELAQPTLYVATGTASDDDMRERIARHRQRRPSHWMTLEEPLALAQAVGGALAAPDPPGAVLVDSLDGWVSNMLLEVEGQPENDPENDIKRRVSWATESLLGVCRSHPATFILVSSEVGLSPVAPYDLGRRFQDLLGLVNQSIAAAADRVYLVVAGVPVVVKGLQQK